MQMVVNELSALFPCDSVKQGKFVMKQFINTYSKVKDIINNTNVLVDQNYQSFCLAPNYRIEQWRNDPEVEHEIKQKFRSMLNRSSVYNSEEFQNENAWIFDSEFEFQQQQSRGCLLAYEMDGVTISFLSHSIWETPELKGKYCFLSDLGEICSKDVVIPNVSSDDTVLDFKTYYENRVSTPDLYQIKSGQDILFYKEVLFPNLVFCENAESQLRISIGSTECPQVYKKLIELQRVAEGLVGVFDRNTLRNASPESQETLKTYERQHSFLLPNGEIKKFSWHIRFTGGYAGRIFFLPENGEQRIYIGHIGPKLPTVKYPH